MPHLALYRKYRSQTFGDLVGQTQVVKTLSAALAGGRISHAYLFVGPRGTGKTSSARILAKALNCVNGPTAEPCNECHVCTSITAGLCPDVLEMDAASEAGVDEVRGHIINTAAYSPMSARFKVFIIDEVHDLSPKAFDALLKTIEEPPAHVVFILATTEFTKVPVTIRSRCQKYEFHRGSVKDILHRLEHVVAAENIEIDRPALLAIARMADGGYRDALTLLEQAAVLSEGRITLQGLQTQLGIMEEERVDSLLEAALSGNAGELLMLADEAVQSGKEPRQILEGLLRRLSELTYALYGTDLLEGLDPERKAANHALAARIGAQNLLRFRSVVADAFREVRDVGLPRLWLEVVLLRLLPTEPAPQATAPEPARERATTPPPRQQAKPAQREATQPTQTAEKKVTVSSSEPPADLATRWEGVVRGLVDRFPSAGKTLSGTRLVDVEGKTAIVEIGNEFQYNKVVKGQKAAEMQETIRLAFVEAVGDEAWTIRYVLGRTEREDPEPVAVELPQQGEVLAKSVEEIFEVTPE